MKLKTIDDGAVLTYRGLLTWAADQPCRERGGAEYPLEHQARCPCLPCAARRRVGRPGTVAPTPAQRRVLDIWRDRIIVEGFAPTLEEVAVETGTNKVTVYGHLVELERKGLMDRGDGRSARCWRPVP